VVSKALSPPPSALSLFPMRRADFEALVRGMIRDVPPGFLDGIEGVEVTAKTLPDPLHAGVYTLGECVPHVFGAAGDEGATLRSTILLHHGSFAALARTATGFDWRVEAWETLTHEVRHHLEWRARVPALEKLDDAVEANYARQEGEPFPALFYRDGEVMGPGITKVEDDLFYDRPLSWCEWRGAGSGEQDMLWHGRHFALTLPAELPDVLFLTLEGLEPEPAGEVVLVLRRRPGARDLWHRAVVGRQTASVRPSPGP